MQPTSFPTRPNDSSQELDGAGGETAGDAELLSGQLGLLELPWETVLKALEEEALMAVGMCLDESVAAETLEEGLALDFVYKPKLSEAGLSEVRFREESNARPAGLLDCVETMLRVGVVPLELVDGLDDGIYTLRVGPNRVDAPERPRRFGS